MFIRVFNYTCTNRWHWRVFELLSLAHFADAKSSIARSSPLAILGGERAEATISIGSKSHKLHDRVAKVWRQQQLQYSKCQIW